MLQRKLWRDLRTLKGQIVTIALVIASASGGFIGSLGTYHALQRARDGFYSGYRFADAFVDVKRAPLALLGRVLHLPGIADAEATVAANCQLLVPGVPEPLVAHVVGIPPRTGPRLNRLYIRRGRMIEPAANLEALVDEGFATARNIGPGDEVSILLNGRLEHLKIVGIGLSPEYINPSQGGAFPDPKGLGVFWIDEERLASGFDLKNAFNHLSVTLAPGASEARVLAELDELLRPYGGRGAYGRGDQTSHRIVTQEMNEQRVLGTLMPSIFIWVAAFLLNVVLGRQIATQREQIAALKALGYADTAIALHYIELVVIVVASGIVLGIAVGLWFGRYMTALYSGFFHFPQSPFRVEPSVVAIASTIALGAGLVGALFAVRRVVQLSPAEAMRPQTPPRYRRLLAERLGLERWIALPARMILRNIERRPVRSMLAILGVAASGALIISGTFWWDAVNYMVDVEFNAVERGDAVISFVEPRSASVRFEVSRLPGVVQAEGFRAVPVQLRAGSHAYRTVVMGLARGGRLRRALDDRQRPVQMPSEGLLMSDRLAERLGVRPGDSIRVQALEGARRERDVLVAGVVRDLFAQLGYMDLVELSRLLQEGTSVSAMDVRLDPRGRARLLARIRQTPDIATLALKANSLASFRETSARNVLVFTSIFTVFAATIAVGVVYNGARISLAERSWELASLRVLGFSRAEISTFLLGEMAIEVGAGIPLGLGLGRVLAHLLANAIQGETFRIPVVITSRTDLVATATVVASAVFSALLVRRRVDRLDLVAVLKTRE